ncbi:MAG: antibiotic biosynthesis monooxygenase, partial [Proteobacteria bacterium]|nr:antibiotic biosynthesis monooxygenase [Pseudomonadota bacterium]
MIVVLFEFEPDPAFEDRYFELAGILRENVEQIEGFISVERFQSIS